MAFNRIHFGTNDTQVFRLNISKYMSSKDGSTFKANELSPEKGIGNPHIRIEEGDSLGLMQS